MIVKLPKADAKFQDLTPGQPYMVIGIEANDYRLLNDHGRPYLYPTELFEIVDSREPTDWESEVGADRERYAYPPPLNAVGFFEDYFDADAEAVTTFWRTVNKHLAAVGSAA